MQLKDALQKDVLEKLKQAKQELAAVEVEKRGRKKNEKEKNGSSASGTNRLRNCWKNPIWTGNDIKAKKMAMAQAVALTQLPVRLITP